MGKVIVKVKLTNFIDIENAENGIIEKDKVRCTEDEAIIDTGATMLTIPKRHFEALGLRYSGSEVTATYANSQKARRKIARGVLIEIMGREAEVECIVEEKYDKILVGQISLEYMDLHVDCKAGKLMPNPLSPDMPLIEIL